MMKKTTLLLMMSLVLVGVIIAQNVTPESSDLVDDDFPSTLGKDVGVIQVEPSDEQPVHKSETASFESKSTRVTKEEFNQKYRQLELNYLLPTKIPEKMELSAIYMKDDNQTPRITILTYSKTSIVNISTAEMTLEIFPAEGIIFDESQAKGDFIEINGHEAYYDTNAWVGHEEYREKYGDRATVVNIYVKPYSYLFRFEPDISQDEIYDILKSLEIS